MSGIIRYMQTELSYQILLPFPQLQLPRKFRKLFFSSPLLSYQRHPGSPRRIGTSHGEVRHSAGCSPRSKIKSCATADQSSKFRQHGPVIHKIIFPPLKPRRSAPACPLKRDAKEEAAKREGVLLFETERSPESQPLRRVNH